VAANLTVKHPEIRSLVMIDPQPPTLGLLKAPRWTRILPVRLLARDHFNPAPALSSRSLDKLLLLRANALVPAYVAKAAAPTASMRGIVLADPETAFALQRFLAEPPTAPKN
jgi:pimeloyl-ACP methyl ester carboxylesterase